MFPQPETDRQLVLFLGQPCPLESVIGLCFTVNDNRTADLVSLVVSWRFCYGPRQERERCQKIYSCLDLPRGPSLRLSLHLPHFKQGVEFSSSWPGVPFCLGDWLLFSLSERKQRWILVFNEPCCRGKWCNRGHVARTKKVHCTSEVLHCVLVRAEV